MVMLKNPRNDDTPSLVELQRMEAAHCELWHISPTYHRICCVIERLWDYEHENTRFCEMLTKLRDIMCAQHMDKPSVIERN